MKPPLLTSSGSALGLPSAVTSQPGGVGNFSLALLRIFPAATVVVAMSSRNGSPGLPGAPTAIGAVPGRACGPLVGATWRPAADVGTRPVRPAPTATRPHNPQAPHCARVTPG